VKRSDAPSAEPSTSRRLPLLLLPVSLVGIGMAGIFVRLGQPAPPVSFGFYRMLFAALGMGAFLLLRRRPLHLRGRSAGLALASGACFGADLAMWQSSVMLTTVATATLLVNVTPVHVGLYARFVRGQRLHRSFVGGAGLALLGTAVLLGEPGGGDEDLFGALLALAASVFYAAYLLVMAEARREIDVFSGLFLVTLGAAVVLGGIALLRGDALAGFAIHSWSAMLGAAGLSQLVGVLGIVWALRFLPTTLASVALLGQPVAAAVLAWWLLDEPMTAIQGIGAVAVLAGIGLASRGGRPQPMPSKTRGFHQGK